MSRPWTPRATPWRALLLVVAGHVLLGLMLAAALRPVLPRSDSTAPPPLWLQLLAEPPAHPEPRPPAVPPPTARHAPVAESRAMAAEAPSPAAPSETSAISVALPAPPPAPSPASAPASAPMPPRPALDLRLPPPAQRPPPPAAMARDDPQVHTPSTRDERLAQALGTDQTLRESVTPDGTRTFRRGRDCVVAREARNAQLDPFNQGARPTPRLIGKC